jgi:hypothetical protein
MDWPHGRGLRGETLHRFGWGCFVLAAGVSGAMMLAADLVQQAVSWKAVFNDGPAAACAVILLGTSGLLWWERRLLLRAMIKASSEHKAEIAAAHKEHVRLAVENNAAAKDLSMGLVALKALSEQVLSQRRPRPVPSLPKTEAK